MAKQRRGDLQDQGSLDEPVREGPVNPVRDHPTDGDLKKEGRTNEADPTAEPVTDIRIETDEKEEPSNEE